MIGDNIKDGNALKLLKSIIQFEKKDDSMKI